jgi:hypothetical protein
LKTPGGPTTIKPGKDLDSSVKQEDMINSTRKLLGADLEKSVNQGLDHSGVPEDEVPPITLKKKS